MNNTIIANMSFPSKAEHNTSLASIGVDNVTVPQSNEDENTIFGISASVYESFAAVSVIVTPVICAFGIIGNALGLSVLLKDIKLQKLSIFVYLSGLTLSDAIYLSIGFIRQIPSFIKLYDEPMSNVVDANLSRYCVYLDLVFSHTSAAIIIVMSIERLVALVAPFNVKNTLLSKYPHFIIGVCLFVNILMALPFLIFLEVSSFTNDKNVTEYYIKYQEDAKGTISSVLLSQTIIDIFIPICILLFTNTGIAFAHYRMISRRRTTLHMEMKDTSNQVTKVTSTVLCITLLYLLLSIPNLIIKILAIVDMEYSWEGKHKLMFWFFIGISNLMSYINAANDFIIYILLSGHYRQVFMNMYCYCKCRITKPTTTTSMESFMIRNNLNMTSITSMNDTSNTCIE